MPVFVWSCGGFARSDPPIRNMCFIDTGNTQFATILWQLAYKRRWVALRKPVVDAFIGETETGKSRTDLQ